MKNSLRKTFLKRMDDGGTDPKIPIPTSPVMQRDATIVKTPTKLNTPDQSTKQFLAWYKSKTSPEQTDAFNSLRYENGNPSVNMINGRSNYTWPSNTLNVDTSGQYGSPIFSALSELAHAKQFKDAPIGYVAHKVRDQLTISGENAYHTKGSIENQAHSVIQPQLKSQYQGRINLNAAKGTSLANDKDFTQQAYNPIKYINGGSMKTKQTKSVLGKDFLKKMAPGGAIAQTDVNGNPITTPNPWTTQNVVDVGSAAAGIGSSVIDAASPKDQWGVRSNGAALSSGALSGAASGAKAGMVFGPEGAIIGGAVGGIAGGVEGLLGNKSANAAKIKSIRASTLSQEELTQSKGEAYVAGNPNAKYGNLAASYYAMGGTMKGTIPQGPRLTKPIRPVQAMPRVMPPIADVPGRQMSRMGFGGTNPFDGNVTGSIPPEMVGVPKHPKMKASNQGGHMGQGNFTPTPKSQRLPLQNPKRMANGGTVEPMSSQDTKINGPSHADGGVKFPEAGVELEGGETVNNGFVFSKKLGFAQQQEKIAKRLGKVEKQPDSVVNRNTAQALQRQTDILKLQQESAKKQMGIPNEIDAQTQQMMQDQQSGTGLPSSGQLGNGGYPKVPQYNIAKQTRPFRPQLYHDPVSKFANGGSLRKKMADGGPMSASDPGVKLPKQILNWNKPGFLPQDSFLNAHKDSLGNPTFLYKDASGADHYKLSGSTAVAGSGAVGSSNRNGYTIGEGSGGQSVPGQKPSANSYYKMGGKLRKMMDGGDPNDPDGPGPKGLPPSPIPGISLSKSIFPTTNFGYRGKPMSTGQVTGSIGKPALRTGRTTVTAPAGTATPALPSGPKFPLTGTSNPNISADDQASLNTNNPATVGNNTATPFPGSTAAPVVANGNPTPATTTGSKVAGIANGIVPFLPNIGAALRRLPLPPKPIMESEIAPNLVDYSASKAEAVRATRGANKVAAQNLNTGAAISATRAANLVAQDRAENSISEGQNAQNAGILNNNAAENLNVRARNNSLQNAYNTELTERQLKAQDLQSQNLASITDKIQQMGRDKKLFDLEGEKSILGYLSNNDSGAGYDLIRPILQKHLSSDQLGQTDAWAAKRKAEAAQDRQMNMTETKARIDALNRANTNKNDAGKTTSQILRGKSIVPTDKQANDEDKTNETKKQPTS